MSGWRKNDLNQVYTTTFRMLSQIHSNACWFVLVIKLYWLLSFFLACIHPPEDNENTCGIFLEVFLVRSLKLILFFILTTAGVLLNTYLVCIWISDLYMCVCVC
eukprot:scpid113598/ scgid35477/ 